VTPRKHYTIRQLADEFGITARTIRFYEQKGILASYRVGSARSYSPRDRSRLAAIVKLRELGFSVTERGEILGDATSGASELKLSLEQVTRK
jgi:DNA-binding transcriptional MerR regulator